jgi:uncharacterized protein YwgA
VTQREFVLACLATARSGSFTPVQLQKLLFLLDRNIGQRLGGSGFTFRPYHYGPFDRDVYTTLERLRDEGLAEIFESPGSVRRYSLTDSGMAEGEAIASEVDSRSQEYISAVGNFVRSHSFASLVSSIYKAYPDMKANSVFQE